MPDLSNFLNQQDSIAKMASLQSFATFSNPLADFKMLPMPRNQLLVEAESNYASEFHKRLAKWITDFDNSLDQAHEVGVRLVSFGQAMVFHLDGMGYWNPSLISFNGHTEDGEPVELI